MKVKKIHSWDISVRGAIELQKKLTSCCCFKPFEKKARFAAAADISYNLGSKRFWAAAVVWDKKNEEIVETSGAEGEGVFPYIPGLLSFREAPLIAESLSKITVEPDVLLVDGHGYAHPRRIGIASHIGLMVDVPTIGCAKKRLVGRFSELGRERFASVGLYDDGKLIGEVLRTRESVKPIFVSAGNNIDLHSSIEVVKDFVGKYRIPEPLRLAHIKCNRLRNEGESRSE